MNWNEAQEAVGSMWMDKCMSLQKNIEKACQVSIDTQDLAFCGEFNGHPVYILVGYPE